MNGMVAYESLYRNSRDPVEGPDRGHSDSRRPIVIASVVPLP
jgi:hypothetical protein